MPLGFNDLRAKCLFLMASRSCVNDNSRREMFISDMQNVIQPIYNKA